MGLIRIAIFLGAGIACGGEREAGEPFAAAKSKLVKVAVDQFAFTAGPQWMMTTGEECPESLLVVARHVGKSERDTLDPWGSPYKLYCGRGQLPPGVSSGFAVMSFGPDKREGTDDDIKSWQPLRPEP